MKTYFKYFFLISFLITSPFLFEVAHVQATTVAENLPPSTITDLSAFNITQHSVDLSWTAPEDDMPEIKASFYDIRHDIAVITEATWDSAIQVIGESSPGPPGTVETMTVTNLQPSTTYYFAIKSGDEAELISTLSNVVEVTTLEEAPPPEAPPAEAPPPSPPPVTLASVSGTITDYNNQPVAEAFVDLHSADYTISRGAMSDSQGNYFIGDLEAETYIIEVYPPEGTTGLMRPAPVEVILAEGDSLIQDFRFPETTKTIKGSVTLADGTPVTGAVVKAYRNGAGWSKAFTDSSGNYLLKVSGGNWEVHVYPQDPDTADWFYDRPPEQVSFASDKTLEEKTVNFVVSSTVVLPTKAGVEGIVTDYTGQPVKDVWVNVHTPDFSFQKGAPTDSAGKYFIGDLEPGNYIIEVFPPPEVMNIIMPDPVEISLIEGQLLTMNFKLLETTKTITGRVTYTDGMPVTDALVHAFKENAPGWAETLVDIQGNYTLKVGGGSWQVMPHSKDRETADWSYIDPPKRVEFALDQTVEQEIVNFVVVRADARVTGKILNPDGSVPAPHTVWVSITGPYGPGGEGELDSAGAFSIAVPAGTYTISIFCEDPTLGIPIRDPFSVALGETLNLGTIYLIQKAEHIKGKVVDEQGRGIANVSVEAFQREGMGFNRTQTDVSGNFDLFITPGDWMVTVMPVFTPEYVYLEAPKKVTLGVQATVTLNFTLILADATISGTIQDPAGNVLTDVHGWAFVEKEVMEPRMGPPGLGGPIERGTFSFKVPAGSYKVKIHLPPDADYSPGPSVPVTVGSGATAKVVVIVRLNDVIIKGQIKDKAGNILTGIMVHVFVTGEKGLWQEAQLNLSTGEYVIRVSAGTWYLGFHVDPSTGYISKPPIGEPIIVGSGQTVIRDIVLIKADSTISGKVTDSKGNPLAHVWVSADSRSFTEEFIGEPPEHFFANGGETDINGRFSFSVPQGTYYIHAFLPPEFGYINPEEQKVTVSPETPAIVNLIFRKVDSVISGVVYLNDVGTSAFVWGWSEKGGFAETKADSAGNYKLKVIKNDIWHIGAVKEIGTEFYKSDEIIIDMGEQNLVSQNLILKKVIIKIPDSLSVTTEATKPRVVSIPEGAEVAIPANALATAGNVTVTIDPEVELPSQGLSKVVGVGYDIEARDEKGKIIQVFNVDVTVGLPYTDEQLLEAKVSPDDLALAFWDETSAVWRKLDNSVTDKTNYLVIGSTNHFTRFAIVAPADITPPEAPSNVTIALAGTGALFLSWENPKTDFHHVKIYRSLIEEELGEIIFHEIASTSQEDVGLEENVTYYYTVRAVDPAGNESTNITQIAGVPQAVEIPPEEKEIPPEEKEVLPEAVEVPPEEEELPPEEEISPEEKELPPEEEKVPPTISFTQYLYRAYLFLRSLIFRLFLKPIQKLLQ